MHLRTLIEALMLTGILTSPAVQSDVEFPLSFEFAQSSAVSRGDSIHLEFVATATNVSSSDFAFSGGFWFDAWYHPARSEMGGRERRWRIWGHIDGDWAGVTTLADDKIDLVPGASLRDTFAFAYDSVHMAAWPGTLVVSSAFICGAPGTPVKDAVRPPQSRERIVVERPRAVRPPN